MTPADPLSFAPFPCSPIFELDKRQSKISIVFDLFRRCAENPILEIGGRQIWSECEGKLSDCHRKVHLVQIKHCLTTVHALLTAIIGPEKAHGIKRLIQRFRPDIEDHTHFQKTESCIQNNGLCLKKVDSCFYAYVFGLFTRDPLAASSHVFLVIQYEDDQRDLRYRVLQSFLDRFDLKADFEKESNFLSHANFEVFLRRFYQLSESKIWTSDLEEFYVLYFHVNSRVRVGEVNPYFGQIPLVGSQQVTFEAVLQNEWDFACLQQSSLFKDIMSQVMIY